MSQMPEDGSSPYGDLPYVMSGLKRKNTQYDRQRQMAYGMMQGGLDMSPIQHPMQGVSRLAQALVGSLMASRADSQEAEADKIRQAEFGKAMTITDPQERLAAIAKISPEDGIRYSAQLAMQEAKAKRDAEEARANAESFGGSYGLGGGMPAGGGQQQAAMPPEQAKAQATQYVNYLVQNHGFAPEQAAAMVGNLFQESGFNPNAVHDNGTGFGMGGWRLDRRDALLNAAKQAGKNPSDPQFQLDFFANELKGRPEFQQFQQAQTPQERQAALMTYFRPAGWTPQAPQNGNGFGNRVQFAQTFAGGPPVAQGDSVLPSPRPPGAVADASGNPLPPQGPMRPTEVPKPEPDMALVAQLRERVARKMLTPAQADQIVREDMNRRYGIAVTEASADRRQAASEDAATRREQARIEAENRREANKPPTAEQALAASFADRMTVSNDIANRLGAQGTGFVNRALEGKVFGMGIPGANYAMGEDYKKFIQARDDFINAQLRRESGAAISDPEYERANRQYFPQPGDSEELIAQKARNRALAVEGMKRNAGNNYKPSQLVDEALKGRGAVKDGAGVLETPAGRVTIQRVQ